MSTTTTTTQVDTIPLTDLPKSPPTSRTHHSIPDTSAGRVLPSVPESRRVFHAEPASTLKKSTRVLITTLVILASLTQFAANFVTLVGGLSFSKSLGRDVGPGEANWMPAAYSLTQGAFVLMSGRLGAVYGHKQTLVVGGAIIAVFSFINAFTPTYNSFVAVRALTGIGGGLIMPNAVAMITIVVPPGRTRNLTMGFFAAAAPVGGLVGAVIAGLFMMTPRWQMMFVFISGITVVLFGLLFFLLPQEIPVDKGGKIDYTGAGLGLSSLILFNFVWNQAPSAGWSAPYEIALLILSVTMFVGFLAWEKYVASDPIMPVSIFKAPTFTALLFVVLLTYMSFGISLWYMIAWEQLLRGLSVIEIAATWTPFVPGSIIAIFIAAWLIPRLAAQYIIALGVVVVLVSNLLLATMPVHQTYWAQTFPAILIGSMCPDLVYVAAQVIASNSVSRKQQGIAGSLIGTLNLYGNSLGLGFAGTIETQLLKQTKDEVRGYRAVLFFGVALAVAGLILNFIFVRVPKDEREGWDPADQDADDIPVVGATLRRGGAATGVENSTAA
ncbi:efflux pump antibiotic resistance protein [Diaporthe amygdali]|uniref:efflux pump antibiotic resistance protein n=1 Tax=Phomopsis amygdali TaxID=1214568 RepID=UPI0022FE16C7|nr:efflux pump antibiotic resistance protein [Diaporthe amygdali]KAJ0109404.1 efflux pump antibiotic resistance protein [Diaporthe amygdali]